MLKIWLLKSKTELDFSTFKFIVDFWLYMGSPTKKPWEGRRSRRNGKREEDTLLAPRRRRRVFVLLICNCRWSFGRWLLLWSSFWCCDDPEATRRWKTSEKSVNLARNEVGLRRRKRAQSERWRNVGTSASGGGGGC